MSSIGTGSSLSWALLAESARTSVALASAVMSEIRSMG